MGGNLNSPNSFYFFYLCEAPAQKEFFWGKGLNIWVGLTPANYGNKFSKEELLEKIVDFEENTKEKELSKINQEEVKSDDIIENNNYDNKDSNMIKEEEEIEESINNNNNNNKNINEKIESEKNKINEDEFVSNILDDV